MEQRGPAEREPGEEPASPPADEARARQREAFRHLVRESLVRCPGDDGARLD